MDLVEDFWPHLLVSDTVDGIAIAPSVLGKVLRLGLMFGKLSPFCCACGVCYMSCETQIWEVLPCVDGCNRESLK